LSNLIIKRPENIFELFSSLLNINGVGKKKLRLLEKKIGPYIINLLFYLPIKSINRFKNTSLKNINHGEIITCEVEVIEINIQPYKFSNKNNISRIITFGLDEEKSIRLDIIYFGKNTQYLKNIYKVGNKIIISGKFESFNGLGQIVHPDYVLTDNQRSQIPKIEPVYPLFLGVNQKFIYKIINQSIKRIPNIPEWLSNKVVEKYKFSNWQDSITKLHNPENIADAELNSIYRRRLAFDELLANQISMLLIKNKISKINRNLPSKNNSQIIEKFYKSLPFKLTKNQIEVVNEIKKDIHDEKTMVRMLQGDVGSGKTIVALISMLHAISDGSQSVLLVPTEILALQHYNTVKNLLTPINIEVVLLLGESRSIHSKKRKNGNYQ
jgi:ATP-dependent DNA helicase RecG